MTLPAAVDAFLRDRLFERRRPECASIDAAGIIRGVWAPDAHALLSSADVGMGIAAVLPPLTGQDLTDSLLLPLVGLPDRVVDVHLIASADSRFVVLLDASREHDLLQQRQQMTNEARLMHANQNRLIRRMRDMIGELVEARAELDHRRREAEKNAASQSRFIAMMSHEFRTPLASIINYADLALDDAADQATVHRSNEAIARASRHLKTLVETILDDTKLEAGKATSQQRDFAITALIEDLAAIMAPLAAEKGLAFSASVSENMPTHFYADDTSMRQILINLLGNAVKFTEHGSVTLDVDWQDDRLRAVVSDTGPGIPMASRQRMFEAFERGSADTGSVPGTGLGLAISQRLAKRMDGGVTIDEKYEQGCRLILEIAAVEAQGEPGETISLPQMPSEHAADEPSIVLLCDDDEDMLALAEFYMHQAGYGLLLARDGLEAVEKALAYEPDLILMDINTPRLNGVDATNRLRQSGFTNPIVALTASSARYFDQASFTAYLRKPIQMPVLLKEIKKLLHPA